MISPANTYHALTRTASSRSLYPDGVRSYARVVTHDLAQGAGCRAPGEAPGCAPRSRPLSGPARPVHQSSHHVVPRRSPRYWRSTRSRSSGLAEALHRARGVRRRDAAGCRLPRRTDPRQRQDTRRGSAGGATSRRRAHRTRLLRSRRHRDEGSEQAGEGMLVTAPGIPEAVLPPAAERFLRELGSAASVHPGQLGAPEAAQAAEVMLDAIARSDGTRASVVEELFATKVENGILGSFIVRPLRRHGPGSDRRVPLRGRRDRRPRCRPHAGRYRRRDR